MGGWSRKRVEGASNLASAIEIESVFAILQLVQPSTIGILFKHILSDRRNRIPLPLPNALGPYSSTTPRYFNITRTAKFVLWAT